MRPMILRYLGLLVLLHGLTLGGPAVGQEAATTFEEKARSWDAAIESIGERVHSGHTGSLEERDLRQQLKAISDAAAVEREDAGKQAAQVKGLLAALGPASENSDKPEAETVQNRRGQLQSQVASLEGRAKQADLVIARVDQMMGDIGGLSRDRLKATLLERTISPLSPKAWAVAVPEATKIFNATFVEAPAKWWSGARGVDVGKTDLPRYLAIALFASLVAWGIGRWLRARYGRTDEIAQPSYTRRLSAGLAEGVGRSLAPIVCVFLFGTLFAEGIFIEGPLVGATQALSRNLILLFLGAALINAALTPRRIVWRLTNFDDTTARPLAARLDLTLAVFLGLDAVRRATAWETPSAELYSVAAFVFTIAVFVPLATLLSPKIWGRAPREGDATAARTIGPRLARLRGLLILALLALSAAAMLGYLGLTSYLASALVMSGLVLGAMGLLRSGAHEALAMALDRQRPIGGAVIEFFALEDKEAKRIALLLGFILDFALLIVLAVALLPVWGLGTEETVGGAARVLRGFKIGSYTVSIMDVLIGLCLFGAIVLFTHYLQKGLERHVLPNLTRDKGVRDALSSAVGYIGFVVATLIGVSTIGLDLTNLALIAGALSVGIGFGLQNVVNNFISGLILLAERPIKPGDWVVVGGHEGTVKKVNVRSTEIETFQRASVIIPNADLIATPVINWTHKNMLGRIEIPVGVAYGSDPRQVVEVLLGCARTHPNVLATPEPFVLFTDFADSSLNFELRAYIANVEKRLHTSSDIRFAIHDALKDKGIEIPFPQRVLHFSTAADAE